MLKYNKKRKNINNVYNLCFFTEFILFKIKIRIESHFLEQFLDSWLM